MNIPGASPMPKHERWDDLDDYRNRIEDLQRRVAALEAKVFSNNVEENDE